MTQAFNLSQLANNVNTSGQLNAAAGLYNQVPVANGGTGVASVATGSILVGAGTAAMTAVAAGTANNVLTSNGTTWTSAASQGGPAPVVTVYTSPAPWTKSPTLKGVKITMVSGGGGGAAGRATQSKGGGGGATAFGSFAAPAIPGPVTITVGAGGAAGVTSPATPTAEYRPGTDGGSSSFGSLMTCTGGQAGQAVPNGIGANRGTVGGAGGTYTPSPTVWGQNGFSADAWAFGQLPASSTFVPAGTAPGLFQGGASGFGWGMGVMPAKPIITSTGTYPTPPYAVFSPQGYGGGGAGDSGSTAANGYQTAGTNGIVIVEEFY